MNSFKKLSIATILVAVGAGVSTQAAPRLTGAGASFPAKIYTRWLADLAKSGAHRSTTSLLALVLVAVSSWQTQLISAHRMIR